MTNITIWNEYRHEKENPAVAEHYPEGIHRVLQATLETEYGVNVRTATLDDDPDHGLTEEILAKNAPGSQRG